MTLRFALSAAVMLAVVTPAISPVAAQQAVPTPALTKPQRELLKAIVTAVGQAATQPDSTDVRWPMHLMRASDGSHYVAFSVSPAEPLPATVMLYVRLATAPPASTQTVSERSPVEEWLTGKRSDPMLRPQTGIVAGEMPMYGAGGIAVRGSTPTTGSNDMSLMAMERARARQAKEDSDRQRRAELEGLEKTSRNILPFEDFEIATAPNGRAIERALTAGPGDYVLYVAWADPSAKPTAPVRVAKKTIHLPPASTTELMLSTVIVADRVGVREQPYSPSEQRAHPYTIGATDITPAQDNIFTKSERLSVAFQVINAKPSEIGKPDITVNFRIVKPLPDREQVVATLTPQKYDQASMPADFDLRLGHPIFAAVAAPLATLPRGNYKLQILVTDRLAGSTANGEAAFSVAGTPASLLAEAPDLGRAFLAKDAIASPILTAVLEQLRPASPSPALGRAFVQAQQGQFAELLREEPVTGNEQGVRTALTALAYFSIGDASSSAIQFQHALQQNAPAGPTQFLLGAALALQKRDADAIAAWQAAITGGLPTSLVSPFLVDAFLRRGDPAQADALLGSSTPSEPKGIRTKAAVLIASGRERDAIALLQTQLAQHPDDIEAEWLLLHAMFATLVKSPTADRAEFTRLAGAYGAKQAPNAALAAEWVKILK